MWPVGSWQWGALTIFCLVVGPMLIMWDSRIAPKLRLLNIEIKQPKEGEWGWGVYDIDFGICATTLPFRSDYAVQDLDKHCLFF